MNLHCPLCNSEKIKFLFNKQQNPHYSCSECGFVFARPEKNANLRNDMKDFEPAYLNYLGEQAHDKKNHDALIKKLSRYKPLEGCSILDIGCGSGKLVKYLRSKGFNASGLEPSVALFQSFLKDEDFFFQDDVPGFLNKNPGAKFDIIIVADVLEHIEHPSSFMAALSGLLLPEGILFISTPDTKSLFARLAGRRWHYFNKYHLSLFSKQNLAKLVERYGLNRVETGYLTRYQSLYYIIKYGWNFLLQTDKGVPGSFRSFHFPMNLFDNQFAVFRR